MRIALTLAAVALAILPRTSRADCNITRVTSYGSDDKGEMAVRFAPGVPSLAVRNRSSGAMRYYTLMGVDKASEAVQFRWEKTTPEQTTDFILIGPDDYLDFKLQDQEKCIVSIATLENGGPVKHGLAVNFIAESRAQTKAVWPTVSYRPSTARHSSRSYMNAIPAPIPCL